MTGGPMVGFGSAAAGFGFLPVAAVPGMFMPAIPSVSGEPQTGEIVRENPDLV